MRCRERRARAEQTPAEIVDRAPANGYAPPDPDLVGEQFARAFQNFLDWVPTAAAREGSFAVHLREHFGADPSRFPATMLKFADYDRPNVQVALDAYLAEPGRSAELLGFSSNYMMEASFSLLVAKNRGDRRWSRGRSAGRWSSWTAAARSPA